MRPLVLYFPRYPPTATQDCGSYLEMLVVLEVHYLQAVVALAHHVARVWATLQRHAAFLSALAFCSCSTSSLVRRWSRLYRMP